MNRRQYLAGVGAASTAGFALLAGCSGSGGGNENGGGGSGNSESGPTTPTEPANGGVTTADEALDTGRAPPSVTGTPYENTNTVPEHEGLETEQAPNSTNESS